MPVLTYEFSKNAERQLKYTLDGICLRVMGKASEYLDSVKFPEEWDKLEIEYMSMPAKRCGFWYAALPSAFTDVMDITREDVVFCMTPETSLNQVMLAMFHARIMLRPQEVPVRFEPVRNMSGLAALKMLMDHGLSYGQAYTLVCFPASWLSKDRGVYLEHVGGADASCYRFDRISVSDWARWLNPVEADKQIRAKICNKTYPQVKAVGRGYTQNMKSIFQTPDVLYKDSMSALYYDLGQLMLTYQGGGRDTDFFGRSYTRPRIDVSKDVFFAACKFFLESRGIV